VCVCPVCMSVIRYMFLREGIGAIAKVRVMCVWSLCVRVCSVYPRTHNTHVTHDTHITHTLTHTLTHTRTHTHTYTLLHTHTQHTHTHTHIHNTHTCMDLGYNTELHTQHTHTLHNLSYTHTRTHMCTHKHVPWRWHRVQQPAARPLPRRAA